MPHWGSSILDEIGKFLNGEQRLLRICVSGIPYEYKAREIIANAIGRELLNRARNGSFKQKPVVLVVDEAHNFLGRNIRQRPRDITEDVLSQTGTLIVHRLINDRDREIVEKACGEIDRAAALFLPNLKPGQAAVIGVDFPIPLTIQVLRPTIPPKSDGPNYQEKWKTATPDESPPGDLSVTKGANKKTDSKHAEDDVAARKRMRRTKFGPEQSSLY